MPNFIELCQKLGIYQNTCENGVNTTSSNCPEQEDHFARISILGMLAQNSGGVLIGIVYDRLGTAMSRLLCCLMMTIGTGFSKII